MSERQEKIFNIISRLSSDDLHFLILVCEQEQWGRFAKTTEQNQMLHYHNMVRREKLRELGKDPFPYENII